MIQVISWVGKKVKGYIINFSEKNLLYIIVVACLSLLLLYRGCNNSKTTTDISKPVMVSTVEREDKSGTVYTEVKGIIYTQVQMNRITDSFKKQLRKGSVVQVINTITPPVHDTFPVTVYIDTSNHTLRASDSNKNYQQTFKGNWITKQGTFTLDITSDTATYVTTWKHRLFRADNLTVNIYHTNDLFKPSIGNVYTASTSKALIDIDWFVGYDPFLKRVVTAPGIGFHIFSIKRKK